MNFVLIGAAGFVAPRHMQAIKDVGGDLVAALDPCDSVGVLDKYFPNCRFFTEFERFDRFCEGQKSKIDWVSICSPNYLHDAHCRFGLRIGANVICEKPLVLKERNLDALEKLEEETGRRVYTVLQLRLMPSFWGPPVGREVKELEVVYVTPRGGWYDYSWKGDIRKSGGIVINIGIHLFDYLIFWFGTPLSYTIAGASRRHVRGSVVFPGVVVKFWLSLNGERSVRTFRFGGKKLFDFPDVTDLHTKVYEGILGGRGFGIEDVRKSVRLCERMCQDWVRKRRSYGGELSLDDSSKRLHCREIPFVESGK